MAATPDEGRSDDVYQPDAAEIPDDAGVLDREDTLDAREADPYDEGWSPPERPRAVDRPGTTVAEQQSGESLDQRLAEEEPDPTSDPLAGWTDGIGDASDTDGELIDDEVGTVRSGRLVASPQAPQGIVAEDVGVDGAAASAEEAAVHVIEPDDEGRP